MSLGNLSVSGGNPVIPTIKSNDKDKLDHGGLLMDLQDILGCKVHVIREGSLSPRYRDRVLSEALVL
jgi:predicted nucleotidyltransferase